MTDEATQVTGGCLCGEIRYAAEVFLTHAYYCHCTQCQKSSGTPSGICIPVKVGTLNFINAEPKYYVSSEVGKRGFCANCSSNIVWRPNDPANESWTSIAVCSLDNPATARPKFHIFVDTKLPWYEVADQLPRVRGEDVEKFFEAMPKSKGSDTLEI